MPIDSELYDKPARRGDISGIAIETSVALDRIIDVLETLSAKADLDVADDIARLKKASKYLEDKFDILTGWTPENPS